jgi:hypothetical protein
MPLFFLRGKSEMQNRPVEKVPEAKTTDDYSYDWSLLALK